MIDQANWDAAMMRHRMAARRFDHEWSTYMGMDDSDLDKELFSNLVEQSADAQRDALKALMDMPAPHLAALRWKLDQAITFESDEDDEYMEAWSRSYVRQTIADYRRLLAAEMHQA
jgi:hypothetical protein